VAVIGDVVVEGFSPEICLGFVMTVNFSPDCFAEAGSLSHFILARRAVAEVCIAGADEPSAAASVLTNVYAVPKAAQLSPATCARNCRRLGLFILCSQKGISV